MLTLFLDMLVGWASKLTPADYMEMAFAGLSIVGQHYISARDKRGFLFWAAGNSLAVVLFVTLRRWPTALLYLYFLWQCRRGFVQWGALAGGSEGRQDSGERARSDRQVRLT